ncbi:hypothetical protein [Nostoc sp.]
MSLTFNPETYALLLAKYQPKVITNDAENEQATLIAEELAHRTNRTSEESALYDLLIALIEKYEDETQGLLFTTQGLSFTTQGLSFTTQVNAVRIRFLLTRPR